MLAALRIGDSILVLFGESVMMSYRSPESIGGSLLDLYVYVKDAEKISDQAVPFLELQVIWHRCLSRQKHSQFIIFA
jgi:hypothetical protein